VAQRNPIQRGWGNQNTAKGLKAPEQPSEDAPDLPQGLSDLPDHDLMELYVSFTNWTGYAGYLVALAEIEERKADRILQRVFDKYSIQHKKEKTVAATKAMVQQEPDYLDAEDAVDVAYAVTKITRSQYTHLESCGKTVSRELSRRLARRGNEDRSDKYNS